ncbi:MAG: hypothetical protein HJJLKODD_02372 [Phycisphaerae bacterium]|nr:hypothetical protein [Phycisphaerae bacterium]
MSHCVRSFMGSVLVLSSLWLLSGCPTLNISGSSGGGGNEPPPGELIEWPARQVDPTTEDTAGFNQVVNADMNGDGLVDLVTAAYESQPIQVHLQQRNADGSISFNSFSVAGSGPIMRVSQLDVADIDQDGNLDIIVAAQDNGFNPFDQCANQQCSVLILFAPPDPSDALAWQRFNLTELFRCELISDEPFTFSEVGLDGNERCYTSLDVGDVNADGFPDVLAGFNGCNDDEVPTKEVQLWINPADNTIRDNETLVGSTTIDTDGDGAPDTCAADVIRPWQKLILQLDFVDIGAVRLSDIDLDEDLDVVVLRVESKTYDLTWQDNPLIPEGTALEGWSQTTLHPIGESDTGLDLFETGDLDGDGFEDMLGLTKGDLLIKWYRHPKNPAAQQFPWEVYNLVQYNNLVPTALDIADVDGNGQQDVVAAADGRLRWFTPLGQSPYDPWSEQFVIDDPAIPDGAGVGGEAPYPPINSVQAVDIDGDGRLDIAATFDRAGVNDDALIWFQNLELTFE